MAIRIRCTNCRKRISVDDAFAGGACRCPYCGDTVMVGGPPRRPERPPARPYAPIDRPETPDEVPPAPSAPPPAGEVPLARPVRVQGVLAVVLLALTAAMAAGAIWLGAVLARADKGDANARGGAAATAGGSPPGTGAPTAPRGSDPAAGASPAPAGPEVVGIPIASPVVYVLDAGGSMKGNFDYARAMTRLSVRSLGAGGQFDLVLAEEEGPRALVAPPTGFRAGGPAGDEAVKEFLLISPQGSAGLASAIEAALAKRPRTVVVFARLGLDGAAELAAKAKTAGVRIVAVGLGGDAQAGRTLADLAGPTGGEYKAFGAADLADWADATPALD